MNIDVRAVQADDAEALLRFFADVPDEDRTFFKEEIGDARRVTEHWLADEPSLRRVVLDDQGRIVAFAALSPGVGRTSHVADLRLVVAAHARGRGLGRTVARRMFLEAVRHGFRKITVDIASDHEGPIRMFRELGFQPEALLLDQLCDPDGQLHDLVVLAHAVDEQWSGMLTVGIDEAVAS
jgi:L-amino acid N-acyltransferase YncA